jgi:hypothetical protein
VVLLNTHHYDRRPLLALLLQVTLRRGLSYLMPLPPQTFIASFPR